MKNINDVINEGRNKNLTVEELIKILKTMPEDAEIFVSNLCMGRIVADQIVYNNENNLHLVEFTSRIR